MRTLKIDESIENAQFIVVLVDYNPNSTFFGRAKLDELPFADQVKIFRSGFGMWSNSLEDVAGK